jgi:hypothetical protein
MHRSSNKASPKPHRDQLFPLSEGYLTPSTEVGVRPAPQTTQHYPPSPTALLRQPPRHLCAAEKRAPPVTAAAAVATHVRDPRDQGPPPHPTPRRGDGTATVWQRQCPRQVSWQSVPSPPMAWRPRGQARPLGCHGKLPVSVIPRRPQLPYHQASAGA